MEWLLFLIFIIVLAVLAFRFGAKAAATSISPGLDSLQTAQAHDRMNFLNTLRRELANYLVWRDPDRYLQLYQTIHAETSTFKDLQPSHRAARFDQLCKQYPHYEDFDLIATRVYVLYADTLAMHDTADIEHRYRDIATFQALLIAGDRKWRLFQATSDNELQHLTKYVQSIKDTQLRAQLARAIHERHIWEFGKDAAASTTDEFDSRDFTVRRVPHFAEFRLGIHVKRTNECGLYGLFHDDASKAYRSYYRTDHTFSTEQHLDILHGVIENTEDA